MSSGDKELELVGNYLLGFFKGLYVFAKNVFYGARRLRDKKRYILCLIFTIAFGVGLFLMHEKIFEMIPKDNKRLQVLKYIVYLFPGSPFLFLYILGQGHGKFKDSFNDVFESIGFYGKGKRKEKTSNGWIDAKDYPKFMGIEEDGKKRIYSFHSNINIGDWISRWKDLENALDCNILKIENAKSTKKVVRIHAVPSDMEIPKKVDWRDDLLIEDKDDKFELLVGENMLEQIKINLNSFPHILVAGETGSGKSVVLRLLLWQGVLKGAKIYMSDFKGGVEFGLDYEQFGEVITEKQRLLEVLKELTKENSERLKLFRKMRVKNIGQYNNIAGVKGLKKLTRVMVFVDEVAEILDKTGASKEDRELMQQIEKEISTLARLGRAPGINLVLGIQRPDAKVITGQIKNNIPVRICGRFADKPASEIVLGNTRATELPEIKGRFLFKVGADTFEFQAYYFDDEKMLRKVETQTGGMLTKDDENEKVTLKKKSELALEVRKYKKSEVKDYEETIDDNSIESNESNLDETKVNIEVWTVDDLVDDEESDEEDDVEILDMEPFDE
ncbi:MAG: segregation ATPase FtsK/SpoIIIE, family [Candidatus Petromonas sp.]|nr:segregation ATPase FtsK/SpoIIIE, family [Candidatus Petromonas sp.]